MRSFYIKTDNLYYLRGRLARAAKSIYKCEPVGY